MPNTEKRTSPARLQRDRKFLTLEEIALLMNAAQKHSQNANRDKCMILLAFRHGLRRSELCSLKWEDIDFPNALLTIHRLKGGIDSRHPIQGDELRWLRKWQRSQKSPSPWIFTNRDGVPITPDSFRKTLNRLGERAGFTFTIHPHMLRHSCGYALAEQNQNLKAIQHYLGHRKIQNTLIYTELSPNAFKDFWQ